MKTLTKILFLFSTSYIILLLGLSLFLSACSTDSTSSEANISGTIKGNSKEPLYKVDDIVLLKPDSSFGVIKEIKLPSSCGCGGVSTEDTIYTIIDQSHKEIVTDGFVIIGKYNTKRVVINETTLVIEKKVAIAKELPVLQKTTEAICQGHNPIPADTIYASLGEILSISFTDNSAEDGDKATVFIGDDNIMSCTQILNVARVYPIKFEESISVTWCACNQGVGLNTGEIQIGTMKFPVLLKTGESHTITILPFENQRRHS